MPSQRLMLFIDYQNSYWAARDTYHDTTALWHWDGQFNPRLVGDYLVESSPYDRKLSGVRVYRGLPSPKHDSKGYGAARAQNDAWSKEGGVTVVTRPLRYPPDYPKSRAEEKGIDVSLAVDFVMGAVKGWYDVGVIMSLDTDVRPALEAVANELHGVRVEVAAWQSPNAFSRRLTVKDMNIWCHWLGPDVYASVQDPTDYTQ